MIITRFIPLVGLLLLLSCSGQKKTSSEKVVSSGTETWSAYDLRFVNYNVENLFDLIDDPQKEDDDFLPWGINKWNQERLQTKLKRIFKVIANISAWEYPGIITLTEIENRNVLEYLLSATPLSESDYHIIHEESPDPRGIDVAMLYRRSFFRPIRHEAIRVTFPFDPYARTRDILYVEGLVHKQDTLHIFVCHFPSRRGGEAASEPRRTYVASLVRAKIDSIMEASPAAKIIVTGDFNDEPANTSMREVLRGRESPEEMQPGDLYNMMYPMYKKGYGSYKFQASWNMLDQFLISAALLDTTGSVYTKRESAVIYKPEWLEVVDDVHPGTKPFRTYSGPNYLGGYSDHFPTYMDLYFRKE
jgi:endonuclease/exonuclease/phosphatase family metal-dependent hydrolase